MFIARIRKKFSQAERKEQLQVCCDENTPCVPTYADIDNSNIVSSASKKPQQLQIPVQELKKDDYSHKGENCHSKTTGEDDGLDIEYLRPELKLKIKEDLEKSHRFQNAL